MKQTKLQKTVELANLALDIAKESLWINNLVGNKWEIVILDQDGRVTNHKFKKCLNNQEILLWINEWTTNYEIMKMWRNKRHIPQFQCYT
tara:strand:+ start:1216 stop:1485 length:270 start_codon:yes stop_codon:yes gene_type:complete